MGLFGKKNEDEFEEDPSYAEASEDESNLESRRFKRKFRDLNPENKKQRKEPPKPWGKKERFIVFGFFLATTLAAAIMFLFSHDFKLPGLPKITFSGINLRNPFSEEVIEIGQKGSAPKDDEKAQKAISLFNSEIKPVSGFYGFLVIRLTDGISYGVSTDSKFQGASLMKLPLMVLAYKNLNLDTKYILKEEDKVKGSGELYTAKVGTIYTYRQLIEFMGKNSDRTAYKVIKDAVGDTAFKTFVKDSGMINTDVDTGDTTPNDIGKFLQKLWNGELLDQNGRNGILSFLTNTNYENWITAGVPKNVKVAHKFGQDAGVMADGGIVLAAKPYILVIMGNGITQHDADLLFPKVSKDVYNVENSVQ